MMTVLSPMVLLRAHPPSFGPVASDVESIRSYLNGAERGEDPLVTIGSRAFPAYETLLTDRDTQPKHISNILYYIRIANGDRVRFVDPAVKHLASPAAIVRIRAAELLECIGSEKDTGPLIALLSDANVSVAYAAASAIKSIGGSRDLIALNVWLNSTKADVFQPEPSQDYKVLREYVIKFRDELEERLEKAKQPKKQG